MLGIGTKEKAIVEATRGRVKSGPINRKSCALGEWASADGDVAPPLHTLKGKTHQARWYCQSSIPDDYIIEVNGTAYTNDQLAFQWIQYFAALSEKRRIGTWRILLLGGHTTHGTRAIIECCVARSILIFSMLPHTTHL
jgi:hypothetical protein